MIQAVIFDVDGVLIDSVPLHFAAWKKTFADQKIAITFNDYIDKINGLPRLIGVSNIMPNATLEEQTTVAEKKQTYLLEMAIIQSPKPLPGVFSLLTQLQKRDIVSIAASSSKNAKLFLKNAGLSNYFKDIITGNDFTHAKPHPDIFLTAAKKINVDPMRCVVIEDAAVGLQAAKNAMMYAIGIQTSHDNQLASHADFVVRSLKEHQKILRFISTQQHTA